MSKKEKESINKMITELNRDEINNSKNIIKDYTSVLKQKNTQGIINLSKEYQLDTTYIYKKMNESVMKQFKLSNFNNNIINTKILIKIQKENMTRLKSLFQSLDIKETELILNKTISTSNIYYKVVFNCTYDKFNEQLKGLETLIDAFYKTSNIKRSPDINYTDIITLLNENYINESLEINSEKLDKQSEKEKRTFYQKFSSVINLIAALVTIFAFIGDTPVARKIIDNFPIVRNVYKTVFDTVEVNCHITSKAKVYKFSSLNSDIIDSLSEGIACQVIEFHSGWLKVKYKNLYDDILEGWIEEDNAIWNFRSE